MAREVVTSPCDLAIVATCNLNQWAMSFDGNLERIKESIAVARAAGARFRLGPELEVTGYGCEDHFLEADTFLHAWESLAALLEGGHTQGILCDIGMPVLHKNVRYNCRVFCLDGRIVLIRPKMCMADDGNYRETRWFTAWNEARVGELEAHELPFVIRAVSGQRSAPFGIGVIVTRDTTVASETCEELFTPRSPHIALGLDGVEIIANGSGSHHQLRKLNTRIELIRSATAKGGGVYMYANQQGCDGGRLYYDGCAMVMCNGHMVAQGSQFSVHDVEVVTAVVDLTAVRSMRGAISSRGEQARSQPPLPRVYVDFALTGDPLLLRPSSPREVRYHSAEEEIALGPAAWMWDYLRRSGAAGFFLPLSGGADSSSVAAIVGVMCHCVHAAAAAGDARVLADVRRIMGRAGDASYVPASPAEIANAVLHTTYMGTKNSSRATKRRAAALAAQLGAYHLDCNMDGPVESMVAAFERITGHRPNFEVHGGLPAEDLALQNIQARLRMVLAYMLAQLLPSVRARDAAKSKAGAAGAAGGGGGGSGGSDSSGGGGGARFTGRGFLLVLGSANVDEGLRGYMTKYDCSSADLNPIGAVSKGDLKRFLVWAARAYGYPALREVVEAPPTAELRPVTNASGTEDGVDHSQTDEEDMGMSYAELGRFGTLRKLARCGPLQMFQTLVHEWADMPPAEVAAKVKRFFYFYSVNRHKMVTLTPSYHAEEYSPDDNRFDLRPFLYDTRWGRQFADIDRLAAALTAAREAAARVTARSSGGKSGAPRAAATAAAVLPAGGAGTGGLDAARDAGSAAPSVSPVKSLSRL